MFVYGVVCAVLSIVNVCTAVYLAMHERVAIAALLTANFAVMGSLIMFGFFG
jgi:hypothetical protein